MDDSHFRNRRRAVIAEDSTAMHSMPPNYGSTLRLTALISVLLLSCGMLCAQIGNTPTVDRLPPGELLNDAKELLPQGVKLRFVSTAGITLTKRSEGWVPHLYNDAVRYCTIGYGHLIQKAPCNGIEPPEYRNGISEVKGEEILVVDLATSQYAVMTDVRAALSDSQFAALTDFVFNVGGTKFHNSTLLTILNSKQFDKVPSQLRRWVNAGGKPLTSLRTRREREIDLFFEGLPKPRAVPEPGEKLSPIDIEKGE